MFETNVLLGVSPILLQPYLNPAFAIVGRIKPTPRNLKGYLPYKLLKMPGYTNVQILYYLCGG